MEKYYNLTYEEVSNMEWNEFVKLVEQETAFGNPNLDPFKLNQFKGLDVIVSGDIDCIQITNNTIIVTIITNIHSLFGKAWEEMNYIKIPKDILKKEYDDLVTPSFWSFKAKIIKGKSNSGILFEYISTLSKNQPERFPSYVCTKDNFENKDSYAEYCGKNFGRLVDPQGNCPICGSTLKASNLLTKVGLII